MKLICTLFILALFSWHSIAGLPVIYPNRITFAELQLSPEKYNGKNIDVIGILSVHEDEVFLCESMDVCLSWSPFRLQIDLASIKKSTLGSYQTYDTCPVIIIAEFFNEPSHQSYAIGQLRSDLMQVELSISRVDYQSFNPNCKAWNDFIEGFSVRYGDKKHENIKRSIEGMRTRTR